MTSFGSGGALPSLGAASSAGHAALGSSGCVVHPWLSPGFLKFPGTVMFAVRKLLLSEPQALLFLSAELLLQLVCRRLSALRLTDLAFRTLQRVARPAFWEWHCLCAGRKRQVPFGFCPHRKRQPFSLTFKTLAYVTHEDICKCFTGEEIVLHHKDVVLQSCQCVPAAFLSLRKRQQILI